MNLIMSKLLLVLEIDIREIFSYVIQVIKITIKIWRSEYGNMNTTLCNRLFYTENIRCNSQLFLGFSYLYGCNTTVFNDFYSSYLKIIMIFHKCINLQLQRYVYIIIHYVSTLYLYYDILISSNLVFRKLIGDSNIQREKYSLPSNNTLIFLIIWLHILDLKVT